VPQTKVKKGDIELGENKRGSGKTVVVEVDEMLEILDVVKVLEGFDKEPSKYAMEDAKKIIEKLDELKDAILELTPEEKIPEPKTMPASSQVIKNSPDPNANGNTTKGPQLNNGSSNESYYEQHSKTYPSSPGTPDTVKTFNSKGDKVSEKVITQ